MCNSTIGFGSIKSSSILINYERHERVRHIVVSITVVLVEVVIATILSSSTKSSSRVM